MSCPHHGLARRGPSILYMGPNAAYALMSPSRYYQDFGPKKKDYQDYLTKLK